MYANNVNTPTLDIKVTKLIITPTMKSYKPMYQRSYNVAATQHDLDNVNLMLDSVGNGIMSPTMLAKVMPNIVSLNENASGNINIVNGWGIQRMRFLMQVETFLGATTTISYIQGYTEYDDRSLSGRLDPNMVFYINSIVNVTRMVDPITNNVVIRPSNSFNIITDNFGNRDITEIDGPSNEMKLIRPSDIIHDITTLEMYDKNDTNIINTIGTVGTTAHSSKRTHNDPIKYFNETVNSVINAKNMSESTYDSIDILREASTLANETIIGNIPLIAAIRNITGEPTPTTFTLNILDAIDPNVQVYNTSSAGDISIDIPHASLSAEDTQDTLNPTFATKTALTITHSLAGILTDNMITKASFTLTNASGIYTVIPTGFSSFIEGIDTTFYMNRVVSYIENVIMESITYNNSVIMEAFVYMDLLGDTTISININNGGLVVFRFPTFCDSLFTPIVTDSYNREITSETMANVFDSIIVPNQQQEIVY